MRLWLVRVLPATLLAGMLTVVPAAGTVARRMPCSSRI
jgi:hypothetical protein